MKCEGSWGCTCVEEDTVETRCTWFCCGGGRHTTVLFKGPGGAEGGEHCVDGADHEKHVCAFEDGALVETVDGSGHDTGSIECE